MQEMNYAEKRITIDFETRSACDLKKAGAYKYSLDETTQATCLAFKKRNEAVYLFKHNHLTTPFNSFSAKFKSYWQSLIDEKYLFVAHNAFFEQCIYNNVLVKRYGWPKIPSYLWRCTAAKAAACALPRSLEGAGLALNLPIQKDKRGHIAMMLTCKPTKAWNAWNKANQKLKAGGRITEKIRALAEKEEPPKFLNYKDNPQVWETLYEYCKIDVITEELLDKALPDLIPEEQDLWFLNQRLNWRGLRIDIPTVKKIVEIMEVESKTKLKELDTLTMGLVTKPGARQSILDFLKLEGIELPDIRAKTIEDVLKDGKLSPDMRRLLEIRKALSKTSTKKYQSFLDRAWQDNRVRDILLFHGASTGRDTGTGVQPHNFPRGTISIDKARPYAAVENIIECDHEMLKVLYGDSLPMVFSSILRNMIIPSEGCELFVADFSKIEVAVLWWLSDNWPGLKILNSGKDPYKYMAAHNTGRSYDEISDEGDERQLGKAQVLGCGFGMGKDKFKSTAYDQYRLKLSDEQANAAVKAYREANRAVVELWYAYDNAVRYAITKRVTVEVGKCKFFTKDKFLWIVLPSGRKLAYREPRIVSKAAYGDSSGEELVDAIQFLGLAPNKKTLAPEFTWGGKLTENIVQAVARDLMMSAMLRLENIGYTPLLMVHDEGICEKKTGLGSLEEFISELCRRPKWADKHLPLDAKGWVGPRYRK